LAALRTAKRGTFRLLVLVVQDRPSRLEFKSSPVEGALPAELVRSHAGGNSAPCPDKSLWEHAGPDTTVALASNEGLCCERWSRCPKPWLQ